MLNALLIICHGVAPSQEIGVCLWGGGGGSERQGVHSLPPSDASHAVTRDFFATAVSVARKIEARGSALIELK